jgi:spermidine synthase
MTRIFLAYALSGFVSLGYQVAWFRIVTDWFGSTNLTFALVVCNFIGGLGAGALLSRRIGDALAGRLRIRDPLRTYGLVETLVGTLALLTFLGGLLPADAGGGFPYVLRDGIWVPAVGQRLLQLALATACVFLPCFFMGVTFPLLCDAFRGAPGSARFPSALYAWNTLGACSGVLACQFLLLPALGHGAMFGLMAALNLALGLWFLATGGAPASDVRDPAPAPPAPGPERAGIVGVRILLACALLSGLLAGSLEGDLFKRIGFAIPLNPGATMSFISFWAILAIFLASATVHRLPGLGFTHLKVLMAAALAWCLASWHFVQPIMLGVQALFVPEAVRASVSLEGTLGAAFPSSLLELLVFIGILVFPPYFLISLLLPWVCNRLQGAGRHLGMAYGLNTVAFCAGLVFFTLIAPRVNVFYSLKLFMVFFALGLAQIVLLREGRRLAPWPSAALLAAFAVACVVTPAGFDPSYFHPGSRAATEPIRALKSNAAHTTFVVGPPEDAMLQFGRMLMSGNNFRSRSYMRLMAHFPLLAQPQPEKALLIAFGVGNTASAIATHESIRRIDVVDLNDKVFETAPEFASTNGEVHLDPRVRLIHDDGRHFLRISDERYDLVTSEPPPPHAAGVYRLYSREYYEAVLAHLTPRGLMSQWLPVYQMSERSVELAVRTFLEVFPHALLFSGYGTDFILVGGKSPIDLSLLERPFSDSERVAASLAGIEVGSSVDLLARVVLLEGELRERYRGDRVLSDQHNDLENLLIAPGERVVIAYDPKRVLADLAAGGLPPSPELERVLLHLGRLRYHARGFPFESLASVRETDATGVALTDADWLQIGELWRDHVPLANAGQLEPALRLLHQALALAPQQPELVLRLALLDEASGRPDLAIRRLREFQRLEPGEAIGYARLGELLLRAGRADAALEQLRIAVRLAPAVVGPWNDMAWILAAHPDPARRRPGEAVRAAELAAELTRRRDANVLDTLSAAYAAAGRFDRAERLARDAHAVGGDDALLSRRLELYGEGRSVVDPSLVRARR